MEKQKAVSFIPTISGSDVAGDFTYSFQLGEYKVFDDYLFYSFVLHITNFDISGVSGELRLSMPAPPTGNFAILVPVAVFCIAAIKVSGYELTSAGTLSYTTLDGDTELLEASMVTSDVLGVRGQIFYRYK